MEVLPDVINAIDAKRDMAIIDRIASALAT